MNRRTCAQHMTSMHANNVCFMGQTLENMRWVALFPPLDNTDTHTPTYSYYTHTLTQTHTLEQYGHTHTPHPNLEFTRPYIRSYLEVQLHTHPNTFAMTKPPTPTYTQTGTTDQDNTLW